MKIVNVVLLFVAVSFSVNCVAQKNKKAKPFEGHIFYSVTPQGEVDASLTAQLPTQVKIYFKGDKTREEKITPMGSVVTLNDITTKVQVVLIDMMGQKMALKATKEEIEKVLAKIPQGTIVVGSETKKLAGLNCKKIDFTQEGKTETIFITEELDIPNSNWQTEYKDVPNVILEFVQVIPTQDSEIKMLVSATEVKKEKIKAEMFVVPTGYQEMSMSEFKKMMGGGE